MAQRRLEPLPWTRSVDCRADERWRPIALAALKHLGFAVIENVLDDAAVAAYRDAAFRAERAIAADLGLDRLAQAEREGNIELRLLMKYEPLFLELLETPQVLALVDALLGPAAVLRYQNAEITPPRDDQNLKQYRWHMNTPRVIPGYVAALEVVFPLSGLNAACDEIVVIPGTQQRGEAPDADFLDWANVSVGCSPRGVFVMDATLWHMERPNRTGQTRVFVNNQFTRSFIKPHFDFVRALGEERVRALPERTRQLLGWHTRIPATLDEFYRPEEERLYRSGQG